MKKLLLLSVALCGATAIAAADVTNPFYVPGEGKFLSDTTLTYQNFDHGDGEAALATENLSYGVAKNTAVGVTVADSWFFDKYMEVITGDRRKNPAFGVNAKYNILDDAAKVQVEAGYTQGLLRFPFMNNYTQSFAFAGEHHAKNIFGTVKAGYDLGDGFLPYASLTVDKRVGEYHQDPIYTGRVALNKTFGDHFTGDAGVSYVFNSDKYDGLLPSHEKAWVADASVNYLFCENMSIGLKAEYLLKYRPKNPDFGDTDAYTIGANLKVAF